MFHFHINITQMDNQTGQFQLKFSLPTKNEGIEKVYLKILKLFPPAILTYINDIESEFDFMLHSKVCIVCSLILVSLFQMDHFCKQYAQTVLSNS